MYFYNLKFAIYYFLIITVIKFVNIKSNRPTNKPTPTETPITILVNLIASFFVGQTTFESSVLTSLKKERGLTAPTFSIKS